MTTVVPLHPEQVVGDEHALLWHVPVPSPEVGRVVDAPGTLGELFADGTLVRGLSAKGLIWLWLDPQKSWRGAGTRVRDALQAALLHPDRWVVEPAGADVLRRVTDYVLDGSLAAYIASHGGQIKVVDVTDHIVEFEFDGACADCPAAEVTLHSRIESAIRVHYPALEKATERRRVHAGRLLLWPRLRPTR